jgi:hypothetical protein
MPTTAENLRDPDQFRTHVETLFSSVRRRLGAVVESVCGGNPKAQSITDNFGVYRKLGWQVWNVVYAEDMLEAIRHLPNERTLKVWNDAAKKKGVDTALIARLDDAIQAFHRDIKAHAEDRETLDLLIDSQTGTRDSEAEERWRSQAFLGNVFNWGVRAKTMLACAIIFPSKQKDDYFDMVRIQALLGLIRTRAGVRWPLAQLLIRNAEGKKYDFDRVPLHESDAVKQTGVPLLEEFCSSPLPQVQRVPGSMGMVVDELLPGAVGQTGSADVVTAEILRAVAPAWPEKEGEVSMFGTGVRTPCELLISDQLFHKSLYPIKKRELCVFGELSTQLSRDERDRIPVSETVQYLGTADEGIPTGEFPRYGQMLELAISQTGYKSADFDVYRVRMKYPPLPVSVVFRHAMAMKPALFPDAPTS